MEQRESQSIKFETHVLRTEIVGIVKQYNRRRFSAQGQQNYIEGLISSL